MAKQRRRVAPKRKRRRRPWLRFFVGLLLVAVVFFGAAGATLWLAESSGIFATDFGNDGESVEHSAEDRRALEDILQQRAPR